MLKKRTFLRYISQSCVTRLQDGRSDVVVLEQCAAVGLRREDRRVVVDVDDVDLYRSLRDSRLVSAIVTSHLQ